jgi:hypothetical protein
MLPAASIASHIPRRHVTASPLLGAVQPPWCRPALTHLPVGTSVDIGRRDALLTAESPVQGEGRRRVGRDSSHRRGRRAPSPWHRPPRRARRALVGHIRPGCRWLEARAHVAGPVSRAPLREDDRRLLPRSAAIVLNVAHVPRYRTMPVPDSSADTNPRGCHHSTGSRMSQNASAVSTNPTVERRQRPSG